MYYDVCDYTNHNTCDCYRLKPLIKKYKVRMQITHHILKMRVLMMVMMTMMMAKDINILVL